MSFYLHGLGHFHPENEITNQFLTDLDIGTNAEWIEERTGILSRRTVLSLDYIRETLNRDLRQAPSACTHTHAETGKLASEMALRRAGLEASDIGMVIAGSCNPEYLAPADACTIAASMGMEVPSLDMNSACTSFHVALYMLSMMRPEALPDFVLVVTAETVTTTVDYSDRASAVLWGDGTTAAILSTKVPSRWRVLGNTLASSPSGFGKVTIGHNDHFTQEGRTVQMFAIKKTVRVLRALQKEYEEPGRTLHFVGHQANLTMLQAVCRQCDIPDDRHHHSVVNFGNTGAAGAPGVVSMRWDEWKDGDDIAVVGVGAGLTWAGHLYRSGDAP